MSNWLVYTVRSYNLVRGGSRIFQREGGGRGGGGGGGGLMVMADYLLARVLRGL